MCYQKINIKNPSKKLIMSHSKVYQYVSCGKCGECRTNKQREYEVRNFYEYMDTVLNGGFVFFDTLTYDQDNVPRNCGFLTFDSRDYVLFMHRLRNNMYKIGFDPKNKNHSLKVFWSSEYGGETRRPHYHALFFVNFDFGVSNPETRYEMFNQCIVDSWKKGRNDRNWCEWHYNKYHQWVAPSGIQSKIVNAQGAISYVSKYVTKDCDYEEIFEKQKYSAPEFLDDLFDPKRPHKRLYSANEKLEQFYRSIKPFHRQSNGLGSCISKYVSEEDIINNRIPLLDDDCQELMSFPIQPDELHGYKLVKSPYYLDRKMFYEYNPVDKCFRMLPEFKEKVAGERFKHNGQYVKLDLDNVLVNNLSAYFHNFSASSFLKENYNIHNVDELSQYITSLFAGRNTQQLSYYIINYHNRLRSDVHFPIDLSIEELCDDDKALFYHLEFIDDSEISKYYKTWSLDHEYDVFKKTYKKFMNKVHYHIDKFDDSPLMKKQFYAYLYNKTFNNMPCFRGFDILLDLYNSLVYYYNRELQRQYMMNLEMKSKYKQLYHKIS